MNFEELISYYKRHPKVHEILDGIKKLPKHVNLLNSRGSHFAFLASGIVQSIKQKHIFILPDKEQAAYFQNDLKSLLKKFEINFFPDSFKKPMHFAEINKSQVLTRIQAVNQFLADDEQVKILVTYPEAILETVIDRNSVSHQGLKLSLNQKFELDDAIAKLEDLSFRRVDFVYEPGEYSVRGGIIDIFSYGSEFPYRIELSDDEVISIRTFDPETQLSEKKISRLNIIPNVQAEDQVEQRISFWDLIQEDCLVWFDEYKSIIDKLERGIEKLEKIADAIIGEDDQELSSMINFATIEEWESKLPNQAIISKGKGPSSDAINVQLDSQHQPTFNKQMKMLIDDLIKNQNNGYLNLIFTENPKQIERFYHIFEDLNAEVAFSPITKSISQGFIDHDIKVACYTDHQIFNRFHKYHIGRSFSRSRNVNLKALQSLQKGDFISHIDHGVGVYSGLQKIEVGGSMQEAVRIVYKDNDLLYVNINSLHKISRFVGKDGKPPKINKLGSDAWDNLKRRTKRKIKDIAEDLIKLYAKRKASKGFAFTRDTYMQDALEASFFFEDTPDQLKSTQDVKADMEKEIPMDRLVCGDVGFGKTEIAVRAAFKAVADSKQVAILVPTTILAFQHYRTFSERLQEFPCRVDFLNRFRTTAEKKEIYEDLKNGKIDILIGTHALLSKQIEFKDLGLLIIDEEQKFGVGAKEKLRNLKVNVDTLTLTATPIPRTLQFSLLGARDLSVINTPPLNRQPITTEVHRFDDELIKESIYYEIYRGGQVFFVHNRVHDIMEMAALIGKLCPDLDIGIAHGQLEGKLLEQELMNFINRKYDVLVSTNIIESGLDIPNANTIIINNAHWFGLSDLHQMRGRVGRSNKKAFCYLFAPPISTLSSDSKKRLKTIEEFSDLGSGFHIAMKDLDIRGAGNLLGGEQSGFIADIGYETFQKILNEALSELKEEQYKSEANDEERKNSLITYVRDCPVDSDIEMMIPDYYVNSINERLLLYEEVNHLTTENELIKFRTRLKDRFGPIPKEVDELINALQLSWTAKKLGFTRIIFKGGKLKCFFITNQSSPYFESELFHSILNYIQRKAKENKCSLKQTPRALMLIYENVVGMNQAENLLEDVLHSTNANTLIKV